MLQTKFADVHRCTVIVLVNSINTSVTLRILLIMSMMMT